jgi:ubiquinone/menaquinone biosynthesis C-methylase UbiE
MADQKTDQMYERLRSKWQDAARANGYQSDRFFLSEQAKVLSALDPELEPVIDLACGSGLMVLPLTDTHQEVYGLDFNVDACVSARKRGLQVIRGDAFRLPFADASVGQLVNCQFLNQQTSANTARFIAECARVLKGGGRLVMTWRHARSLLHRTATAWLKLRQDPAATFPQFVHPPREISALAQANDLDVDRMQVTLPLQGAGNLATTHPLANAVGASYFTVLRKQ